MTTHVLIVGQNTFMTHLEYMFLGTGAGDKGVDFNATSTTKLHHSAEDGLTAMMADGSRMRAGDYIIFYLQASAGKEGRFYGIFKVKNDGVFLETSDSTQFLKNKLGKSLTFRQLIEPYEVYAKGVTEWEALDEIKNIQSPCQMLWSLIYRKLKGNRGNTMITKYESERLFDLIRRKNNNTQLNGSNYTFAGDFITVHNIANPYTGQKTPIDIVPRLIEKFQRNRAHETHLQMYITQNVGKGTNKKLDNVLNIGKDAIEWIGNEVSCGVGMQRIDVMISKVDSETERTIMPIELKAVCVDKFTVFQLERYVNWIEQYYYPNRVSTIQPVLICKECKIISEEITKSFHDFNKKGNGRYLPLIYITYNIDKGNVVFNKVKY